MTIASTAAASGRQYLTFSVAQGEYALSIEHVRGIVEYVPLTRVPRAPAAVRGVMNLRGAVLPVVDLAVKFGAAPTEVGARTCVVIIDAALGGEPAAVGLLADSVNQVVDLAPEMICAPPAFGTAVRADHLLGLGRTAEAFVMILDIQRILAEGEIAC
jgi:purine-binding chemotaxis protein CheW